MARRGFHIVSYDLPSVGETKVYTSELVKGALDAVTMDMDVFQGVKLGQLLEAFYQQGVKVGRAEVKHELLKLTDRIPQGRPGRPRKRKKKN